MRATKQKVAVIVARQARVSFDSALLILDQVLNVMVNTMAQGEEIEFRNFGVFKIVVTKPRIGRNPNKPEDMVLVPARRKVKFIPGKWLKEEVRKLKI